MTATFFLPSLIDVTLKTSVYARGDLLPIPKPPIALLSLSLVDEKNEVNNFLMSRLLIPTP